MAGLPHPLPVASPTWEISVRMIPRYCLPCPRASMPARNSFLSWISFTTRWGRRVVHVQGSREPAGSWDGWRGQQVASLGERKQFWGQTVFLTLAAEDGAPPRPPLQRKWPLSGLHSSKRSSSGAESSCRTGGGFLFHSSESFPVAKIFWSLRFSLSRSPAGPRNGLIKAGRAPHSWHASLQGPWPHGGGFCKPGAFHPGSP